MAEVRAYRPKETSLSVGQVLSCPYTYEKGKIILSEMSEALSLDLVKKGLATDALTLTVSYDNANLQGANAYAGELSRDPYGRTVPKHARGTRRMGRYSSSTNEISDAFLSLYGEIVNHNLQIRRFNVTAMHLQNEIFRYAKRAEQIDIFSMGEGFDAEYRRRDALYEEEKKLQRAMIHIKERYGKNAIVKGLDFEEGATARERNEQIGGHKA